MNVKKLRFQAVNLMASRWQHPFLKMKNPLPGFFLLSIYNGSSREDLGDDIQKKKKKL